MRSSLGWKWVAASASSFLLAGCGVATKQAVDPATGHAVQGVVGRVHGGQQPVAGSKIQLYTVGITGDGSASTPLLTSTVTTDADGNFTLTGKYACTNATQVYLTAIGGQPLTGVTNANLAMMTALGSCTQLQTTAFVMVNEVTTVAAVSALAPFMTGPTNVGSGVTDANDLAAAFTLASEYANPATGYAPGVNVPSGTVVPTDKLYALANVAAACVNSAGTATTGTSGLCGQLFALATPTGGVTPTDTITAMLNIQENPTTNVAGLFALSSSTPPFGGGSVTAPDDFGVRLTANTSGGAGVLTIAPTALSLGTVTNGPNVTGVFPVTITNTGGSPVSITGISMSGVAASEFFMTIFTYRTSLPQCGYGPLAAGTSCIIMMQGAPSFAGVRSAFLKIISDAANSPQMVPVSINSVDPATIPVISPTALSFTRAYTLQDVTLTNPGTVPYITLTSVTLDDTTNFSITANTCTYGMASGKSCTVTVRENTVNVDGSGNPITTNAHLTMNYTSTLGSTSTVVNVTATPAGRIGFTGFAAAGIGQTLTANMQVLPVSSSASVPLSGSILTAPGTPQEFTVGSPSSCVAVGSLCQVAVKFTPTGLGFHTERFVLSNPGATGEYFTLSGTIAFQSSTPNFNASNSSYAVSQVSGSLATHLVDGGYGPVSYTLINTGNAPLKLSSTIRGPMWDQVTVDWSQCTAVIPVGTCTFTVNMVDGPVFSASGYLEIYDQNNTLALPIPLTATRVAQAPGLVPGGLSFNYQTVNVTSAPRTFYVFDNALHLTNHTYQIAGVAFPYALVGSNTCTEDGVTPCTFKITYTPFTAGYGSTPVTIKDLTTNTSASATLYEDTNADDTSWGSLSEKYPELAPYHAGTTPAPKTVTITNTHGTSVIIGTIDTTLLTNATQTNTCKGATLPANGTCTFTITPVAPPAGSNLPLSTAGTVKVQLVYGSNVGYVTFYPQYVAY